MKWELYRWVWVLKSPLFVGRTPAGALNRCRLYIPARSLWGAITAEIARINNENFPDYATIGNEIKKSIRFTFLFPAIKTGKGWKAWLPCYLEGKGLCWVLENENKNQKNCISNSAFRAKLLGTRPGTAIDPKNYSAEESSLHETECIQTYWRLNDMSTQKEYNSVGMIGYIFLQKNSHYLESLKKIKNLFIGGDTRYGFGKLIRSEFSEQTKVFGEAVDLSKEAPVITSYRVLGPTEKEQTENESNPIMIGDLEVFSGWDYTSKSKEEDFNKIYWIPGSSISSKENKANWRIEPSGFWKNCENLP